MAKNTEVKSQYISYSSASVTDTNGKYVSALVGNIEGTTVSNSYATGKVTINGTAPIQSGGAVALYNGGTVSNLYWDTQTTGLATSTLGTGKTTAELKAGLPTGFDPAFWAIDPTFNNGYPYLKWQRPVAATAPTAVPFGVAAVTPAPTPTPVPTPTPPPTPCLTCNPTPTPTPAPSPASVITTVQKRQAVVQTEQAALVFYGPPKPDALTSPNLPGYRADGSKIDLWSQGRLSQEDAAGAGLQYAYLANAAYGDGAYVDTPNGRWSKVGNWMDILFSELRGKWPDHQVIDYVDRVQSSGFSANVYQKDGHYVLAFRGSEKSYADWFGTNIPQGLGQTYATQYEFADYITVLAKRKFGADLQLTGHSLGGGLAQYAASKVPGVKAVTFNAAGLGNSSNSNLIQNVINIRVEGDPVSRIPFTKQVGIFEYQFNNPSGEPNIFGRLDIPYYLYAHTGSSGNDISIQALSISAGLRN